MKLNKRNDRLIYATCHLLYEFFSFHFENTKDLHMYVIERSTDYAGTG